MSEEIKETNIDNLEMPRVIPPRRPECQGNPSNFLPILQLKAFDNHPFDVPDKDNPEMQNLMQSIQNNGLLEIPTVRKIKDDEYQIISGHRRVKACEYLGYEEIPVQIITCKDDEEATLIMLNSNMKRKKFKLSEQIKSCRVLYNSKKHQGRAEGDSKKSTRQEVANVFNNREGTVQIYMELSKLSDTLLHMLDSERFTQSTGRIISKLKPENQKLIENILLEDKDIKIKSCHVNKILEDENNGTKILTIDEINKILELTVQQTKQSINRAESTPGRGGKVTKAERRGSKRGRKGCQRESQKGGRRKTA